MLASRAELRQAKGADIRFSKWQDLGRHTPADTGEFESVTSPPVSEDANTRRRSFNVPPPGSSRS